MRDAFDGSILNKCRERRLFQAAVKTSIIRMLPTRCDEQHGLRKAEDRDKDGERTGFDEFDCYSDLWAEERTVASTVWANIEIGWLSLPVRELDLGKIHCSRSRKVQQALYTLYEVSMPKSSASMNRTPIFHLPVETRRAVDFESLPIIQAQPDPTNPSPAKRQKTETYAITRGMVAAEILDSPVFQDWASDLWPDPAFDESLPTLKNILNRKEHRDLRDDVQRRMNAQPIVIDRVLKKLYRCRGLGGRRDEYKRALREGEDREMILDGFDPTWEDDFEDEMDEPMDEEEQDVAGKM